jgi:hypothetical protein
LGAGFNGSKNDPEMDAFLASLDLVQFSEAFAAEDVEIESLKLMADSDLIDLGSNKRPMVEGSESAPFGVTLPFCIKSSQVNTLPKAKSQAKDKRAKDRQ